jgi:hypothetical protein
MREITTTVHTFDELSETAQQTAVAAIAEKLGGAWWDSNDVDDVRDEMARTLAAQLGTPGHDKHGAADFPGIDGVELVGWSLDRGGEIAVTGTLTRETAPSLPWTDSIEQVDLKGDRVTLVTVVEADRCTCSDVNPWVGHDDGCLYLTPHPTAETDEAAMEQAVHAALSTAWTAGEQAAEYKSSDEAAREWIESSAPEFTEDGTPYL